MIAPAPGHVFDVVEAQSFQIRATDPDGDPWVGIIEVTSLDDPGRVTSFPTAPASSGAISGGVAVPPLVFGRYAWRARAVDAFGNVGPWSGTSEFRVGSNRTPDPPVLLVPAEGAELRRLGNEPFVISGHDPDGDPYTGTVTIRRNADGAEIEIPTTPARSGGTSSGVLVQPLPEGSYTWWAEVADVLGARSPRSASRSFSVGPPPTAGGGAVVGSMTFEAPGLSPGTCEPSSSTLALDSGAAVFNTAIVGYVGPLELEGSGASPCESALFGAGQMTVVVRGTSSTGSTLSCDDLQGSYVRVEASLLLSLEGGCVVNNFPISRVALTASLQLVPEEPQDGVTERIERAFVGGAFTALPE